MFGIWEILQNLLGRRSDAPRPVDSAGPGSDGARPVGRLDGNLTGLLTALAAVDLNPGATEFADLLWLAAHLDVPPPGLRDDDTLAVSEGESGSVSDPGLQEMPPPPSTPSGSDTPALGSRIYPATGGPAGSRGALGLRAPAAPALGNTLGIARALRPLHRRVPSRTRFRLDEDATAERIAEQRLSGHQFWEPALVPARVPWFELALVLDRGATMVVWRSLLLELCRLFGYQGAFQRVRVWSLDADGVEPLLYAGHQPRGGRPCQPAALIAGPTRRLILVASDCIGRAWHNGSVAAWLTDWSAARPLALLQPLPQRLWDGTALGRGLEVRLRARRAGPLGGELEPLGTTGLLARHPASGAAARDLRLPIITLEPPVIQGWGKLLCGRRETWCIGVLFGPETPYAAKDAADTEPSSEPDQTEILARLADFQANASPLARRLAALLAAAPLTLPVMRLVQRATLPESGQGHLAEIFLSGLLRQDPDLTSDADAPFYDYRGDCRQSLLGGLGGRDSRAVLQVVSEFVAEHTGRVLDFAALIADPDAAAIGGQAALSDANSRHFAEIGATVIRRLGGRYVQLADGLATLAAGAEEALTNAVVSKPSDGDSISGRLTPGESVGDGMDSVHFRAQLGSADHPGLASRAECLNRIVRGLNPYVTGPSLPPDSPLFFGRQRELAETLEVLRRPEKPGNVSVLGERRFGKSSFLNQVYAALAAEPGLISIYASGGYWLEPRPAAFFGGLHRAILRALGESSHTLSFALNLKSNLSDEAVGKGEGRDYAGLRDFLLDLAREGLRFVLVLDEFESIAGQSAFDADFFSNLRALGERPDYRFGFLISSRRPLKEFCRDRFIATSSFWNIFGLPHYLGLIAEADAQTLASEPLRLSLPKDRCPDPDRLWTHEVAPLTGCHPALIQMVLAEHWNAWYGRYSLDHDRIEQGLRPYLEDLCRSRHGKEEWRVLIQAASEQSITESSILSDLRLRGLVTADNRPFSPMFGRLIPELIPEGISFGDALDLFESGDDAASKVLYPGSRVPQIESESGGAVEYRTRDNTSQRLLNQSDLLAYDSELLSLARGGLAAAEGGPVGGSRLLLRIRPVNPQTRLIRGAVAILRRGGVIVYPTDCSYALGCQVGEKDAMERMRRIRQLGDDHNFTLVCRDLSEIATYAKIDKRTFRLLRALTPGPYTFILVATKQVPRRLLQPQRRSVAIRVPDNEICRALLGELHRPLLSTTLVLPRDEWPMTDPEEIREVLPEHVDLIIDGGFSGPGRTTVIDMIADPPQVLRMGKGDVSMFES